MARLQLLKARLAAKRKALLKNSPARKRSIVAVKRQALQASGSLHASLGGSGAVRPAGFVPANSKLEVLAWPEL